MKLKLGYIDVLNVLPVYYSLQHKKIDLPIEWVVGKVTELNQMLRNGDIDVSVVSSFEYCQHPELYYIFPELSVSADGGAGSIFLFLSKPLDELKGERIFLTEYSLTSVHLIQYLLKDMEVVFTQNPDDEVAGTLLIADDAIRRAFNQKDPYIYDLSSLWKTKTGLPFVFALWVVRRKAYEENPDTVQAIYSEILKSKKQSTDYYRQMAREKYRGVFPTEEDCTLYLKNLHYDFSAAYQKGLNLFQEKMLELGKLKQIAPLIFLPEKKG